MLTKKELKKLKEDRVHFNLIKKMLDDECKVYIQYANEPTSKIKQLLKSTNDSYLTFILQTVLDVRYKNEKKRR